jgi:release factor glutamine methyltransferase
MTLHEHVTEARGRLVAAGIEPGEAAMDAELLARHALGWDRAAFLARWREPPPDGFLESFEALVARRLRREPMSQILGRREFWGLEFEVTRDVLTPRPETELVVEAALACFRGGAGPSLVVDAGTGSGCLAVALAVEFPRALVVATDISPPALAVAARNAARHGVGGRVRLVRTSTLDALRARAELIVSNPPYVPLAEAPTLPPEVHEFEPPEALFGGEDGLDAIRRLVAEAPAHLSDEGRLVFEFGAGQADAVRALVEAAPGLALVSIANDLQGTPRVAVARRR